MLNPETASPAEIVDALDRHFGGQKRIPRELGVDRSAVWRWRRGLREMSLPVRLLAGALLANPRE